MQTYSSTQATNVATAVGLLLLILNHFHINIGSDQLTSAVGDLFSFGGLALNWYHRYRQGDLTLGGFRK